MQGDETTPRLVLVDAGATALDREPRSPARARFGEPAAQLLAKLFLFWRVIESIEVCARRSNRDVSFPSSKAAKTLQNPRLARWLLALLVCATFHPSVLRADASPVGLSEIVGTMLKPLLKHPTSSLRVYAFQKGVAVAIPFQIDERDTRDHWANDEGDQPVRDDSPGQLDENDVVAFMNRDLGAKGDSKKLPTGAATWFEVRVGPHDAPLGYVYVGAFDSPPPLADKEAGARYDIARDEVFAERYYVHFGGPLPDRLDLVHRRGERGTNVLNGVRARGKATILGVFHIERGDKDLRYTLQGGRNGPLRAIRSAKYWIPLPLGFKARGRAELIFYADSVEARAHVNVKIPPRLLPADGEILAYFDFHDLRGARVLTPDGVLDEIIDGKMSEKKIALATKRMRWAALLLPDGRAFLLAVRLGGSLQRLDQQLYFDDSDDPTRGKPSFGFRLTGVNRLDTGEQEMSVSAMILDTVSPTEITAAANALLATPEVSATELP